MTIYQMTRIAGYGLEAVLRENNQIEFVDSKDSHTIVIVDGNKNPRMLAQFKNKTNHRAGQHSDSKMSILLECTINNIPELEEYC